MKTVAITGHRPEKIPDPGWARGEISDALQSSLVVDHLIQGMASGVDLWSGDIAYALGILYTCAIPWAGHKPRKDDEELYERVRKNASVVEVLHESEDYPGPWIYQVRNKWMVDHADLVLAVWDGSRGGTYNCVDYALDLGLPVFRIDPDKKKRGWFANGPV